jgi:hypothetical protein
MGATCRAPFQERATISVTTSGAEAGLNEVIENTEESSTTSPAAAATAEPQAGTGFGAFGLSAEILKAVADSGYTIPTPIQAQGIPQVLQRRDMIGIAQTGTGKTASFTLPMIEMLSRGRSKARMPRALVLEPTRELADQVSESFDKYSKYSKLSHALLIGGVSMDDQVKKLDRGVDVLIATPGRLMDHFERGRILLSQVNILVIDEADRMLDMGFIPDVRRSASCCPSRARRCSIPPLCRRKSSGSPISSCTIRYASKSRVPPPPPTTLPKRWWKSRPMTGPSARLCAGWSARWTPPSTTPSSSATGSSMWMWWPSRWPSTASMPRPSMATWTSRCE